MYHPPSTRGAMCEITGHLMDQGYAPTGRCLTALTDRRWLACSRASDQTGSLSAVIASILLGSSARR